MGIEHSSDREARYLIMRKREIIDMQVIQHIHALRSGSILQKVAKLLLAQQRIHKSLRDPPPQHITVNNGAGDVSQPCSLVTCWNKLIFFDKDGGNSISQRELRINVDHTSVLSRDSVRYRVCNLFYCGRISQNNEEIFSLPPHQRHQQKYTNIHS